MVQSLEFSEHALETPGQILELGELGEKALWRTDLKYQLLEALQFVRPSVDR